MTKTMSIIGVWIWSLEQHTKTVAKATEKREKMRRAFENIIQVAGVKESEFKGASVAFTKKRQKKWVAVRVVRAVD